MAKHRSRLLFYFDIRYKTCGVEFDRNLRNIVFIETVSSTPPSRSVNCTIEFVLGFFIIVGLRISLFVQQSLGLLDRVIDGNNRIDNRNNILKINVLHAFDPLFVELWRTGNVPKSTAI